MFYIFLAIIILVLIFRIVIDYREYKGGRSRRHQLESELKQLRGHIEGLRHKMKQDESRFKRDMQELMQQYQKDVKRLRKIPAPPKQPIIRKAFHGKTQENTQKTD